MMDGEIPESEKTPKSVEQPVAKTESTLQAAEPVTKPEPTQADQLVTKPEPMQADQLVTKPEPIPADEPVTKPEPIPADEPVTKPELIPVDELVTKPEPTLIDQPVVPQLSNEIEQQASSKYQNGDAPESTQSEAPKPGEQPKPPSEPGPSTEPAAVQPPDQPEDRERAPQPTPSRQGISWVDYFQPLVAGRDAYPINCVICWTLTGLILIAMLVGYIIIVSHEDQRNNSTKIFLNERFPGIDAMADLAELVEIGSKPTGSYENEHQAVEFLKNKLYEISNATPPYWNSIDIDVQVVSGSFRYSKTRQTYYQDLQNVVAKIHANDEVEDSILVNCHFDSVFTSPGASDNGLNCIVMLHVLSMLSQVHYPLRKNVIFLFNGGEEDGLQGSHGFITKHKWANEVICFVNLDACGAGGRPMLFQTGPNAYILAKIYAETVPYPKANVLIEEAFQGGGVPSDTDFRNFRDFGGLKGLDFAQCDDGFVYHTRKDDIAHVNEQDIQIAGDNLALLVEALIGYDDLNDALSQESEQAVYFDIFGKFVICYKASEGKVINICIAILSAITIVFILYEIFRDERWAMIVKHVLIDFGFIIVGLIASYVALFVLATVVNFSHSQMVWYSNQWLVLTYYVAAVVVTMVLVIYSRGIWVQSQLTIEEEVNLFIVIFQTMITVVFVVTTLTGSRSSYVMGVGLLGASVSHYIIYGTPLKKRNTTYKAIVYLAINLLALLLLAYIFIPTYQMSIPMSGRGGADNPSEFGFVARLYFPVVLTTAYILPLILLIKDIRTVCYFIAFVYLFQILLIVLGVIQAFSDSAMQRFEVMHVSRRLAHGNNINKSESYGYLVEPNDILGGENILNLFPQRGFKKLASTDECTRELFCGVPALYYRYVTFQGNSYWTTNQVERPKIPQVKRLEWTLVSNTTNTKSFYLTLNGSKFMDFVILPLNGAKLYEWSINPTNPGDGIKWNDKRAYFIRYHQGSIDQKESSLELKFNVTNMKNRNDYVFKFAWSVFRYSNTTDGFTPQFTKFIKRFPSWTNAVPMVVDYEEYLIGERNE